MKTVQPIPYRIKRRLVLRVFSRSRGVGILRPVDKLGRVVIPKEIRRLYGFESGSLLEIFVDGNAVIFRKLPQSCRLCGRYTEQHLEDNDLCYICPDCQNKVAQMLSNKRNTETLKS